MTVIKDKTYLTEIVNVGLDGEGVALIDGQAVFVPYATSGDLCKIKVTKVNKNYATAKLVKVVRPSALREKPSCPVYGECGGCCLQHVSFEAENNFKREFLKSTLHKSGIDVKVEDTVFDAPYGYRNKLQMPFGVVEGTVMLGFYARGTHRLVPLKGCPLHGDWAAKLISIVNVWANGGLGTPVQTVYDEKTRKGLLRHLVARNVDSFLSVVLVVNGRDVKGVEALYDVLKKEFNCNLYISENRSDTNVIMGTEVRQVFGGDRERVIDGIMLTLSPLSFLQVNDAVREKLYAAVCNTVRETDVIIDVYSGVGIMTAMLARGVPLASVYGIEIVKQAVVNADGLMWANGLDGRVENICGDAACELPKLVHRLIGEENLLDYPRVTVVIDPPRKGCDKDVLNAIMQEGVYMVIYISCNPATLARDLKQLTSVFDVQKVVPFNMFPRTSELETMVVLTKK